MAEKKPSKGARAYGKARGVISKTYPGGGPGSPDFSEAQEKSRRAYQKLNARIDRIVERNKELKGKIDSKKVDRLLKDTYKDVLDPTTKENKAYTEKILKGLRKAGIKIGLAGLAGPAGLLAAGISEAAAATPAGAGEDELLYKMRRKKVPGGGPDEAFFKRQKKGGGKIKKNYSKGGGVRPAGY